MAEKDKIDTSAQKLELHRALEEARAGGNERLKLELNRKILNLPHPNLYINPK